MVHRARRDQPVQRLRHQPAAPGRRGAAAPPASRTALVIALVADGRVGDAVRGRRGRQRARASATRSPASSRFGPTDRDRRAAAVRRRRWSAGPTARLRFDLDGDRRPSADRHGRRQRRPFGRRLPLVGLRRHRPSSSARPAPRGSATRRGGRDPGRSWARTQPDGVADDRRSTCRSSRRRSRPGTGRRPRTAASTSSRAPGRGAAASRSTARRSSRRSRRSAGWSATPTSIAGAASSTTGSSLDGQLGQVAGSASGEAIGIDPDAPHRRRSTVQLTATERDRDLVIYPPASMTIDDEPDGTRPKRDRLARLTRLDGASSRRTPTACRTADIAERVGMSVRTVYRDLKRHRRGDRRRSGRDGGALGDRPGEGLPAAAQADPGGGDGRRPVGAADGPLRGQVRPRPGRRLREARGRACRRRSRSTSSGPSTSCRRRRATSGFSARTSAS